MCQFNILIIYLLLFFCLNSLIILIKTKMILKSINPSTGKKIKEYKCFSENKVNSVINNVYEDYHLWKNISIEKRSEVLLSIAKKLKSDLNIHSKMISIEMGKPITESRSEVLKCVWVIEFYVKNSKKFLENEYIDTEYDESFIQYEPLGMIFGVMPWNFPYWQVFRFIVPSLIAGNVCVVKHAPNVSGCALLIEKLFNENLIYKNIFKVLLVSKSEVSKIISNVKISAVTFTGSENAGSQVAMKSGKEIKKTVLELGGSDSFIVLEDANVDIASKIAIKSRFFNSGQSCIAAKRFLVHKDIYDVFIEKIKKNILDLKMGDPLKKETNIGPLAKIEFVDKLDTLVKSSIKKGAKCLIGGKKKNFFYYPTLLVDVDETMDVFNYETFGPIFSVIKINNAEEAIEISNNSIYGLGGSVWTSDLKKGKKIASKIESGAVFINDMTKSDPRLPFGGIKKSGYGKELSVYGIKEFVNMKTITVSKIDR